MTETNDEPTVFCVKLKKTAPKLPAPPYPGPLGAKIFDNICQEAWQMWIAQQTILINENRLSLASPEARKFLETEMQKFFFNSP